MDCFTEICVSAAFERKKQSSAASGKWGKGIISEENQEDLD